MSTRADAEAVLLVLKGVDALFSVPEDVLRVVAEYAKTPDIMGVQVRTLEPVSHPSGITYSLGEIIVCDRHSWELVFFAVNDLSRRARTLSVDNALGFLCGVAATAELVFVAGYDGVAALDRATGEHRARLGEEGFGVAVDGGELFVVHSKTNAVSVFDARTLEPLRSFRSAGVLNDPLYVAVHGDELYITDRGNTRIQVLSRDLQRVLHSWTSDLFSNLMGVAVLGDTVYVSDGALNHVAAFSLQGEHLRHWGSDHLSWPYGLVVHKDELYVVDDNHNRVVVYH